MYRIGITKRYNVIHYVMNYFTIIETVQGVQKVFCGQFDRSMIQATGYVKKLSLYRKAHLYYFSDQS